MRVRVFRGDRASKSAVALARAIGGKVIKREGSRFRPRRDDVIVNWGCTEVPGQLCTYKVLNNPDAIAIATNKLVAFGALAEADVPIPEYTTNNAVAQEWLDNEHMVIRRTLLRGSEGRGIEVLTPGDYAEDAPLFTKYFKGRDEYRIHVINGSVYDRQQKRRRDGGDALNEVRNLANGWVFCREGVEAHEAIDNAAIRAVASLGLDWGAVDLKVNRQRTRVGVLEVNTAPGLEGSTLGVYAEGIGGML